jgi:hypothetical protein
MGAGKAIAAAAVGLGTVLAVRRVVDGKTKTPTGLEPWEREALAAGDVGVPEGADPFVVDELAVGRGVPTEYCVTLRAASDDDDELVPHCVIDPLEDPRFAPVDRGAPASAIPSSSTWPVRTRHSGRLVVSYWTASGARGYSGRAFAAKRVDRDEGVTHERRHAGVDLFARAGDVVVAPEDGTILRILPFHAGTWGIYLRSMLGDRVVNLGEVEKLSWREFDVRPGQAVLEGQALARIGVQARGSTMLHVETYAAEGVSDEELVAAVRAGELSWSADEPAPKWLRDPTGYLLMAARRTYLREDLRGEQT